MTLRGKQDFTATRNLAAAAFFIHPDSFIRKDGHLALEGADKSRVRPYVFAKHKNRCCICQHKLDAAAPRFNDLCGDWHHPDSCDCVDCSELRCDTSTGRPCHAHGTPGFEREAAKYKAKQEFDEIQGGT